MKPETTKAKFTRGPWIFGEKIGKRPRWEHIESGETHVTCITQNRRGDPSTPKSQAEAEANASLIAAAGTSATQLEDAGYDGLESIRMLSEIVETLEAMLSATEYPEGVYPQADWVDHTRGVLTKIKRKGGMNP